MNYKSFKCTLCGDCVNACPTNSLDLFSGVIAYVSQSCIRCKECADACLNEAITWK